MVWPEKISYPGLDSVGKALENFYIYSAYGNETLEIASFEKAVAMAPKSFMAWDLYGWALYRNRHYNEARKAFLSALSFNSTGAGAMAGLMWCAICGRDLKETMFWSGRKADVRGKDVEAAREKGRKRYMKVNG